jgi:hypothetical protein
MTMSKGRSSVVTRPKRLPTLNAPTRWIVSFAGSKMRMRSQVLVHVCAGSNRRRESSSGLDAHARA